MERLTTAFWLQIISYLALGFSLSWALIGIILKRAEKATGGNRTRDFHHGHKVVIPRVGGIALAAAFCVIVLVIYATGALPPAGIHTLGMVAVTSLAMFSLGLWDDLRPVDAKLKLGIQVAIAIAVYCGDIRIELLKSPFTGADIPLGVFGFFATVLWLVSLTNLINLIDGIDGLAGGICLMLMFLMANLGMTDHLSFSMMLSFGLSGALIGFLKFNYPPAKIYMGDGGAYFMGFLIGILAIVNSGKGTVAAALIAPAFALALPIIDVGFAVLRRGLGGLPIFRPDRKHIHHHLLALGISRERTLLNLYTVSLLCLFLAISVFSLQGRLLPLYTGLLFLVLLIAGHLSGLTKNWFRLSSQLGKSLGLRKKTQYALTLDRWLVMESELDTSMDELWEDYQFVVRKLGFSRVAISSPDGAVKIWGIGDDSERFLISSHEIGDGTLIEFHADKAKMSELLFQLYGDLAAEMWYKAALRGRRRKKVAATLTPTIPSLSTEIPAPGRSREPYPVMREIAESQTG